MRFWPANNHPFQLRFLFLLLAACCLLLLSCQSIDLYEKDLAVPGHAWKSSFKPQFKFIITDTNAFYNVYIVLRHNEKYNYNNIWLNLSTQFPHDTVTQKVQYELPLAIGEEGWTKTSSAMDDLYEHRILITSRNEGARFRKGGEYVFTIEQIMREDPLENILNIGLRIEKKPQ